MTEPTTLSAAELDARPSNGPMVCMSGPDYDELVSRARRTEAAERENALLKRSLELLTKTLAEKE